MQLKKTLLSIIVILLFLIIIFLFLNGRTVNRRLTYDAVASTSSGDQLLGDYTIEFNKENLQVIETKDYIVPIQGDVANICNTKIYTYDEQFRLTHYDEVEKYDGEEKYTKSASIDYSDKINVALSENSLQGDVISLNNDMPYTMNSSFPLSYLLGHTPDVKTALSFYEGKGFITNFEYLHNEALHTDALDTQECSVFLHSGLFATTYWINSSGIIFKIQQEMDENYTVTFTLKGEPS